MVVLCCSSFSVLFFTQLCSLGVHLCCHEQHLVHCAICCGSLGVGYYHILDPHFHFIVHFAGTTPKPTVDIWYVSPSEPGENS